MELENTQPGTPARQLSSLIPSFSQLGTVFGLAAALAVGIGTIMWSMQPDYVPLYPNLAEQDAAVVADTLRATNIPYRMEGSTGLILIPAENLQEVRMKLAAQGLPQSTGTGFELLHGDQGLGTSQFIETARYQHALETELSRSISAIRNVDTARVHLAVPKQSAFVRKKQQSSASVMVKVLPGRALEKGQIAAIVHLVASSVPYLESSRVTIVDQWGRLLTTGDVSQALAQTTQQFEHARKLEETYATRIEALLTPILGAGRVRAEVNAELEFSLNESTQESFEPGETQVRSEQVHDQENQGSTLAAGVPGALTNQPPGAGTTGTADNAEEGGKPPVSTSRSATRNFELDKTITHRRDAAGSIKRLTVAVVADDRLSIDENGDPVRTPLSDEEIQLITNLVSGAIGLNEERGDSIVIYNSAFLPQADIEPLPELAIWEQPWVWGVGKNALAATIVLLLIFMVIRPAMKTLQAGNVAHAALTTGGAEPDDVSNDTLSLSAQTAGQLPGPTNYDDQLDIARTMASDDPKLVAKVVKDWVADE